jgi:hypothetical protein
MLNEDVGSAVIGLIKAFEIVRMRLEFTGRIDVKKEGITIAKLTKVQVIEDVMIDDCVSVFKVHDGVVPVRPI